MCMTCVQVSGCYNLSKVTETISEMGVHILKGVFQDHISTHSLVKRIVTQYMKL